MALLSERYAALPRVERAWMNALQVEAQQSLVPFHTKVANGGKCTVRRFSIVLGLLHLAPNSDTEVLRSILATIIGDVALFPSVKPGHALGSLTAEEAKVFARRAEMFVSTAVPGHVDDSGVLRLTFDDGAAAA